MHNKKKLVAALLLAIPVATVAQEQTTVATPITTEQIIVEPLPASPVEIKPLAIPEPEVVEVKKPSFFDRFRRKPKASGSGLDQSLQARLSEIYSIMQDEGYDIRMVEGYRTPERQAELLASGGVTQVGPGRSCHQYGLAADSAIYVRGRPTWNMDDPHIKAGYMRYGELAVEAGLQWGGNWSSFKDYPHVEMRSSCQLAIRNNRLGLDAPMLADATPKKGILGRIKDRVLGKPSEPAICSAEFVEPFGPEYALTEAFLPDPFETAPLELTAIEWQGFAPFSPLLWSDFDGMECSMTAATIGFACVGAPFNPAPEALTAFSGLTITSWDRV